MGRNGKRCKKSVVMRPCQAGSPSISMSRDDGKRIEYHVNYDSLIQSNKYDRGAITRTSICGRVSKRKIVISQRC